MHYIVIPKLKKTMLLMMQEALSGSHAVCAVLGARMVIQAFVSLTKS